MGPSRQAPGGNQGIASVRFHSPWDERIGYVAPDGSNKRIVARHGRFGRKHRLPAGKNQPAPSCSYGLSGRCRTEGRWPVLSTALRTYFCLLKNLLLTTAPGSIFPRTSTSQAVPRGMSLSMKAKAMELLSIGEKTPLETSPTSLRSTKTFSPGVRRRLDWSWMPCSLRGVPLARAAL